MESFEGQTDERRSEIRPITFLEDEQPPRLPVPLVRVNCCGLVSLEVLTEVVSIDPPRGRYSIIATQTLRGRGAVPALMLLKLLVSQPHRFASNDWLSTQMQQEMERWALVRLDTMASQLRTLLCGLEDEQTSVMRLRLVQYLRNGRGSGPGYRLAPYPLIWLDTEALAWNVEQAARMERFGEDALPWWERAYALASRGTYLPDDLYSEWSADKRAEVEGTLRQSVHALARLYLAQQGEAGAEEVMRLLRSYWLAHKTDEDALRPLMELLGRYERYQEAEAYYQQLLSALREEEREQVADPRTQDLREFLRTKQLQRLPTPNSVKEVATHPDASLFTQTSMQQHSLLSPFSCAITQDIIEIKQELFSPSESGIFIPGRMLTQMALGDSTVWFGSLIAQIIIMINQWSRDVFSCADLQKLLDQEILMSMKPEPANEAYMLSRRQALITLATLPLSLLASTQKKSMQAFPLEDFLPQCAASLTACWHLLQGNQLAVVEEVLPAYLPTLVQCAQHPSPYQKVAATLSSQSYLIRGLIAHHQIQFMARQFFCQEAIRHSLIAEDYNLQAAGLMHLGNTFYYNNEAEKALHTFQQALPLIKKVSPLLRSCIHMRLAMASARCNQSLDNIQSHMSYAHQEFPAHPEHDPSFLYAEYGLANLHLIEGLAYLDIGEYHSDDQYYQRAWSTFSHIKVLQPTSTVPERNRIQIINYQAKTAAILGDQERFCAYLKMGIDGARALESQKRRQEAIDIYWQGRKLWPNDTQVKALADLFVQ